MQVAASAGHNDEQRAYDNPQGAGCEQRIILGSPDHVEGWLQRRLHSYVQELPVSIIHCNDYTNLEHVTILLICILSLAIVLYILKKSGAAANLSETGERYSSVIQGEGNPACSHQHISWVYKIDKHHK